MAATRDANIIQVVDSSAILASLLLNAVCLAVFALLAYVFYQFPIFASLYWRPPLSKSAHPVARPVYPVVRAEEVIHASETAARAAYRQPLDCGESLPKEGLWAILKKGHSALREEFGQDACDYFELLRYAIMFCGLLTFVSLAVFLPVNLFGGGSETEFNTTTIKNLTNPALVNYDFFGYLLVNLLSMALLIRYLGRSHASARKHDAAVEDRLTGVWIQNIHLEESIESANDVARILQAALGPSSGALKDVALIPKPSDLTFEHLREQVGVYAIMTSIKHPDDPDLIQAGNAIKHLQNRMLDVLLWERDPSARPAPTVPPASSPIFTARSSPYHVPAGTRRLDRAQSSNIWRTSQTYMMSPEPIQMQFLRSAFVTFQDVSAKQAMLKLKAVSHPLDTESCRFVEAPHPADLNWQVAPSSRMEQRGWTYLLFGVFVLVLFFWAFPIDLIITTLLSEGTFATQLEDPILDYLLLLVRAYTPPLLILAFTSLLPPLLLKIVGAFQHNTTRSHNYRSASQLLHMFYIFNVLLFPLHNYPILGMFYQPIEEFRSFAKYLSATWPTYGAFFLIHTLNATCIGGGMRVAQVAHAVKILFASRRTAAPFPPPAIDFHTTYASHCYMLSIAFCYAILVPVLCPVALAHFVVWYVVDKVLIYRGRHRRIVPYDGKFAFYAHHRIAFAITLQSIAFLGYLLHNGRNGLGLATGLVLGLDVAVFAYVAYRAKAIKRPQHPRGARETPIAARDYLPAYVTAVVGFRGA